MRPARIGSLGVLVRCAIVAALSFSPPLVSRPRHGLEIRHGSPTP